MERKVFYQIQFYLTLTAWIFCMAKINKNNENGKTSLF